VADSRLRLQQVVAGRNSHPQAPAAVLCGALYSRHDVVADDGHLDGDVRDTLSEDAPMECAASPAEGCET